MGPLQFIKQCEWQYEDNKKCPDTKSHWDWECDPRTGLEINLKLNFHSLNVSYTELQQLLAFKIRNFCVDFLCL